MPSDSGTVLGFDTSGGWIAAAVIGGGRTLAHRHLSMPRGQGEALLPFLAEVLTEADRAWSDLAAIGVGTGPGNFTGIRISVACARGLALSLGIPAIGVSTFDAIHHAHPDALAAVPAPRDHVYLCAPQGRPRHMPLSEVSGVPVYAPPPAALAVAIAAVAAGRSAPFAAPAPMYIKPADAAPSRDVPPVMLP
ncbi:MAG: tRNA (adenosine(37)-N6)-threonylcarbamoyltransferase complex dimerization subunit type 1 TsaB [Rhodobacteraceae bacterium]|nr:tRNA (adenosine(37)-N6)-threonylcarbamoyltransferase complex dimerization subunit type 1 TsaB [Paracoccaceae bacterium]